MVQARNVQQVHLRQFVFSSLNPWRMEQVLSKPKWKKFEACLVKAPRTMDRRVFWHVNSTAAGGGVAEMLSSLLPYLRGAGLDVRWMVVLAEPPFFKVTKRLHNLLHGVPGDGEEMGPEDKKIYEKALAATSEEFCPLVQAEDVVVLHDPQTAGLIPELKKRGATIIWRSHIGTDQSNEYVEKGWNFLKPYLTDTDAFVFTRKSYVPEFLKKKKVSIIAPSIDPFSPKNQSMENKVARSILSHVGLIRPRLDEKPANRSFFRQDGSPERVDRWCDVLRAGPPAEAKTPLVVQISRWDNLKDPVGVMMGFANQVVPQTKAHLILAGPSVQYVADDPEGAQVLADTEATWRDLPMETRSRIHLACIPMRDLEENAAIVNALQRHASIVVQKSLKEGFGLTVTEAMWKGPPVVASGVGGIKDQIKSGKSGMLLDDPKDLDAFGNILVKVLKDKALAQSLGCEANATVRENFLFNRHLEQYFDLIEKLLK